MPLDVSPVSETPPPVIPATLSTTLVLQVATDVSTAWIPPPCSLALLLAMVEWSTTRMASLEPEMAPPLSPA